MDQSENMLTKSQFDKVFSYRSLHNLFLINIGSYYLVTYYMNFFLTNRFYKKSSYYLQDKYKTYAQPSKIDLATKAIYILEQAFISNTSSDNLDILFLSRNRFFTLKNKNGKSFVSDYLFGNIIHELKLKHPDYKNVLINMHFESTPEIDDINAYSLVRYSSPFIFFKSALLSIFINLKWRFSKEKFYHFLKDNCCDYLFLSFEEFFTIKRMFHVHFYDYSLQNLLNKHKPKLVMANDDVMYLKPKSNVENLKLVLLQSASIDCEKEEFKKMFIDMFSLNNIIADSFLVSGTKFEIIKRSSNDSKEVIVVGQPRYDVLHYVDKIYSKHRFFEKYNIEQNKKIILWTTQCHGISMNENIVNFNSVFSAISHLNNVILLIKQHPAEGDEYEELIKKYISLSSSKVILLPRNSDTYEQIFCSDLLITKDSTTAMEAIALGKPLLILNLSDNPDRMDYVNKGVALGVYSKNNLLPSITQLLDNCQDLEKYRSVFLLENLYKNDGNSTDRVIKYIEKVLT